MIQYVDVVFRNLCAWNYDRVCSTYYPQRLFGTVATHRGIADTPSYVLYSQQFSLSGYYDMDVSLIHYPLQVHPTRTFRPFESLRTCRQRTGLTAVFSYNLPAPARSCKMSRWKGRWCHRQCLRTHWGGNILREVQYAVLLSLVKSNTHERFGKPGPFCYIGSVFYVLVGRCSRNQRSSITHLSYTPQLQAQQFYVLSHRLCSQTIVLSDYAQFVVHTFDSQMCIDIGSDLRLSVFAQLSVNMLWHKEFFSFRAALSHFARPLLCSYLSAREP